METILRIKNLEKHFPIKKKNPFSIGKDYIKANKDISVDILKGETLGIVGESGCGKSTFGRTIIQLQRQTSGSTLYYGETLEDFTPLYMKKIYQELPQKMKSFEKARSVIAELENKRSRNSSEADHVTEQLRLKKAVFENDYGNMLRLVGGLILHEDLKKVSKTLLAHYQVASSIAKSKRSLTFNQQKQLMGASVDQKEIDRIEETLQQQQEELVVINETVSQLRKEVMGNKDFEYFEQQLDSGIDLANLTSKESQALRKDLQIIFQDPYSSLDPRLTVGEIIGEGLLIH